MPPLTDRRKRWRGNSRERRGCPPARCWAVSVAGGPARRRETGEPESTLFGRACRTCSRTARGGGSGPDVGGAGRGRGHLTPQPFLRPRPVALAVTHVAATQTPHQAHQNDQAEEEAEASSQAFHHVGHVIVALQHTGYRVSRVNAWVSTQVTGSDGLTCVSTQVTGSDGLTCGLAHRSQGRSG